MPGHSPALYAARKINIEKARAARHLPVTDAEYLARYILKTKVNERGCWIWQGGKCKRGYGETSFRGVKWRIHRLVLVLTKGPIPADWDCCHTCDTPSCINPKHLFGGTRAANVEDMRQKGRGNNQQKTACKSGHAFDAENTYLDTRGFRQCRACQRIRMRKTAGWTHEQAVSIPVVPHGHMPVGAKWHERRSQGKNEHLPQEKSK